jgi:hypothetical protein
MSAEERDPSKDETHERSGQTHPVSGAAGAAAGAAAAPAPGAPGAPPQKGETPPLAKRLG